MTDFESRAADWLSVEEALVRVLRTARVGAAEHLDLTAVRGRALAAPLHARTTLPPWDNSGMDGYAVRAEDVLGATPGAPVRLPVRAVLRAGGAGRAPLEPGTAVRIMTGAPLPLLADTVVRVEDTDREAGEPGTVEIRGDRDAGRNVRLGGQDMRAGEEVLPAGTTLGPGQIAVAAAAGHASVPVIRLPSVAILSTGDELRTLDDRTDVERGEAIPESNGPMLAAMVAAAGCTPLPPRLAPDDADAIETEVRAAFGADVLVTSGGASVGEADLLKRVLEGMGLRLDFWRVRLRPGSPFSLGVLPRDGAEPLTVFGLPGNPASAFVTFELFVRPYLLRAAGHARVHRAVVRARAGEALTASEGLTHFHRVALHDEAGGSVARLTGHQGSGLVQSLGRADGLAVVPRGRAAVAEGEPVDVLLLSDGPGARDTPGYGA